MKSALRRVAASLACALALLVPAAAAEARDTQIVVDDTQPLSGAPGYQLISGRAFGELDPNDPLNGIIQDIRLGSDPDGKVRYVASFVLTLPTAAGSVVVTNTSAGKWYLYGGAACAAVGVVTSFLWKRTHVRS